MIAAFMLRHFVFCLSVGLELSGFEFKSSLNLEQVCKNKKMKKVSLYFSFPAPHSGSGPFVAQPHVPSFPPPISRAWLSSVACLATTPVPSFHTHAPWPSSAHRSAQAAPAVPPLLPLHHRTRMSAAPFSFLLRRSGDGACHPWQLTHRATKPTMAGIQNLW